jgi:hypothetical protein
MLMAVDDTDLEHNTAEAGGLIDRATSIPAKKKINSSRTESRCVMAPP